MLKKTAIIFLTSISLFTIACASALGFQPFSAQSGLDSINWTAVTPALSAINRAALGHIGDYIYVFGGLPARNTAMAFHIPTEQWFNAPEPPQAGENWNAVVAAGELYLMPPGRGQGQIQKFTPVGGGPSGTWTQFAVYPQPTWAFAAAWDGGNYIYCAGGSQAGYSANAYRLNLTTASFDTLPPMPESRGYVGGAFLNERFYVVGGLGGNPAGDSACFEFNPASHNWSRKADLPVPVGFTCFCTASSPNYLYVVGGNYGYGSRQTDAVQVYDPAADTWTLETPRITSHGTNAACYVPHGHYLFDLGGYDGGSYYVTGWKGLVSGEADIIVTLTPHNSPIQIPAGGGNFAFDAVIENLTAHQIIFDAWTDVILPNGAVLGPLVLRTGIAIAPGQTITRTGIAQSVPGNAPPGTYNYMGSAGTYPGTVEDSDCFPIIKLPGDASPNHNQGWSVSGWNENTDASSIQHSSFGIQYSYPNPFNASTALSFKLQTAGYIKLAVYDISGREIALLAEGLFPAGTHQAEWDASGMGSGVYFAKLTADNTVHTQKLLLVK